MGHIYKRGGKYWIKYYDGHGNPFYQPVSDKYEDARKELKFREGQIAEGKHPGPRIEKVTFDDLSILVLNDYIINKKRSLDDMERYVKKLGEHFKGMPAVWIESDKIDNYIKSRLADGVANATINRELSALKRMFHLGAQRTPPLVFTIPYIPKLEENNVRTGFLEYDDYKKLYGELPEYLRPALCIGYHTGAREEEILTITWDRVDLTEGAIYLDPKNTKTKEPRIVYLTGEFYEEIAKQKELRDALYPECPYVVFNKGKMIKDFGTAWNSACKRAGLEGLLFHDLRRSGCRNLIAAGVDEKTAMLISGHKTSDVFKRYQIVNEANLKEASEKVTMYFRRQTEKDGRKL
jgi:integrase